jgi:hypothetical protein
MYIKYVIYDRCEGRLELTVTGYNSDDAYEQLCIAAAENNCQDWEIEEEYET